MRSIRQNIPHFHPFKTGHPAWRVLKSPSPDRSMLYQKTASPWLNKTKEKFIHCPKSFQIMYCEFSANSLKSAKISDKISAKSAEVCKIPDFGARIEDHRNKAMLHRLLLQLNLQSKLLSLKTAWKRGYWLNTIKNGLLASFTCWNHW